MRPREWIRGKLLQRATRKGKKVWGRQVLAGFGQGGDPGLMRVPMKGHATISAIVIRRDQAGNELSREDLGVIAETELE